jgi:hypothetical protein
VAKWKRASSLGQSIPATIGVDAERDRLDSVAHRLAGHAPLDPRLGEWRLIGRRYNDTAFRVGLNQRGARDKYPYTRPVGSFANVVARDTEHIESLYDLEGKIGATQLASSVLLAPVRASETMEERGCGSGRKTCRRRRRMVPGAESRTCHTPCYK